MLVLVVAAPSGAGKDTLLDAARQTLGGDARFRFVRREITRPAAAGGEAHIAVDFADVRRRARDAGPYALHWEAHGLGYGIPADIAEDIAAGRIVIANVSRAVIAEAARRFRVQVLEITAPAGGAGGTAARRVAARPKRDIATRLARSVGAAGCGGEPRDCRTTARRKRARRG